VLRNVDAFAMQDFTRSHMIFADAPGGTGKTFVNVGLCAFLRSKGLVVLATAASGIAAQLMPGGRTAHGMFKIPIKISVISTYSVKCSSDDPTARLIEAASLIIMDEASMLHWPAIAAVDRAVRDILDREDVPFGGLPVLFTGDFRQILPIVQPSHPRPTMEASLEHSPMWQDIQVMYLKVNMRIEKKSHERGQSLRQLQKFSEFLLRVGDGCERTYDERGKDVIRLPDALVNQTGSVEALVTEVFPNIRIRYDDKEWLCERAILTPLNVTADDLNRKILRLCPGEEVQLLSSDSVNGDDRDDNAYNIEYLHTLTPTGVPPHELYVKIGAPIILLRTVGGHRGA